LEQGAAVAFYRAHAQAEVVRDFFIALVIHYQPQHLQLAPAEVAGG